MVTFKSLEAFLEQQSCLCEMIEIFITNLVWVVLQAVYFWASRSNSFVQEFSKHRSPKLRDEINIGTLNYVTYASTQSKEETWIGELLGIIL